MKVRYTTDYTDEHDQYFPLGCVAEHDETEALKRIALGVCEETDPNAFSRLAAPGFSLPMECATPPSGPAIMGNPGPELINMPTPKKK